MRTYRTGNKTCILGTAGIQVFPLPMYCDRYDLFKVGYNLVMLGVLLATQELIYLLYRIYTVTFIKSCYNNMSSCVFYDLVGLLLSQEPAFNFICGRLIQSQLRTNNWLKRFFFFQIGK